MRALTIRPATPDSLQLEDVPEPDPARGAARARARARDLRHRSRDRLRQVRLRAAESERLILGHESLGRVHDAPPGSGFATATSSSASCAGPIPVPCANCAAGEWDMCRNGQYTERGIKELHGFGAERWRIEPDFAVKVDPALGHLGVLLEPASVVAKAWEHIERIGRRARLGAADACSSPAPARSACWRR